MPTRQEYNDCMKPYITGGGGVMVTLGAPRIELDKDFVISLFDSGLSTQQIAPFVGVSPATVNRRLKEWGYLVNRQYPAWNKGLTASTDESVRTYSEKASRFSGHKHTADTRDKMSVTRKGQNTWSRGREKCDETKERNREATKRMWRDPEYREKVSQGLKDRWGDPAFANRWRAAIIKGLFLKPTKPEQRLIEIIERYNLPFRYTGDGSFVIYGYNPDFVNTNGEKTVIEVFGDYWHGKGARTWKQTEIGRMMAFNSFGYECIIIWERELKTETDQSIIRRISDGARRL